MPTVPKRDAERRRTNERVIATTTVDIAEATSRSIVIPLADEEWGSLATMIWESLPGSGQAHFYEPSDWAIAYMICEQIDIEMRPRPVQIGENSEGELQFEFRVVGMAGAKLASILKAWTSLMATEGDRRKLAMEIERNRDLEEVVAEGVASISAKRIARLSS